jgi:hypothetical protein
MALKRYSDFDKNDLKKSLEPVVEPIEEPTINTEEQVIEEPVVNAEEPVAPVEPIENQPESTSEKYVLKNNIAEFSPNQKPSDSYEILVNDKISSDSTKFVISEQEKNSISIFKYDLKSETNLSEFGQSLINYYKKKPSLKLENVKVSGNDKFIVIQNLPNNKFVQVIKHNLIDLLK